MGMTPASFRRSATVALALAAMLFRGVLPVGWMPADARDSGTPIVICTVSGPVHLHLGNDGRPLEKKTSHNDGGRAEMCPFAGAPQLATLAAPAAAPGAIIVAARVPSPARADTRRDRARFSPHSPRAPPSLA